MKFAPPEKSHARIWKPALLFLLFLCVILSAPGKTEGFSIEDERLLGKEFIARVARTFRFLENDTAAQYLRDLGTYLGSFVDNKPFELNFYILHNPELNAFAAPGGHIFINTGLILEMENADELAAVLTHEIAHVTARHLAQRIAQHQKLAVGTLAGVLAGVLIGGEAAEALIAGSVAASMQAQLHYSRNDERHADQLGFDSMLKSGFQPEAMIGILEKITRSQWEGGPHRIPGYLRTHPAGPERMSNLEVLMSRGREPAARSRSETFRNLFPSFQVIVAATSLSPVEAEKSFRRMLSTAFSSREKSLAHLGLGIALGARARYADAVEHLQASIAMGEQPEPALIALGNIHRTAGNPREAISVLDRVLMADANNPVALYLTGLCYQQMERYDQAVRYFERLAAVEYHKDDVFYQLGVAYGRLDELALAHFYFGRYFARISQGPEILFHFRKAEELAKDQPRLLDRIRREMQREGLAPGRG